MKYFSYPLQSWRDYFRNLAAQQNECKCNSVKDILFETLFQKPNSLVLSEINAKNASSPSANWFEAHTCYCNDTITNT